MFDNNQHAQLSVMLKKLPTAVRFDSISIFYSILAQESRLAMRQNYLEKVDLLLLSSTQLKRTKIIKLTCLWLSITLERKMSLLGNRYENTMAFFEMKSDFGMNKVNYPENTLFYLNQAYLTVQKDKNLIYNNHIILGQIIPTANFPDNIENYECTKNEVKLVRPLYNGQTGEFLGLRKSLAFINIRREKRRFSLTTDTVPKSLKASMLLKKG